MATDKYNTEDDDRGCDDPQERPLPALQAAETGVRMHMQHSRMTPPKGMHLLGADMPASVRMIVSGHVHSFRAVDFGGIHPPQLVVATGGDTLNLMPPMSVAGTDVNNGKVVNFAT